jgi:hypothetical protein
MTDHPISPDHHAAPSPRQEHAAKARWQRPKLTFVEPTLTKQGDIKELTGYGFFGSFYDGGS